MNENQGTMIIGASGHAKVVLSTVLANGVNVIGFLDDNQVISGTMLSGYPVLGPVEQLVSRKCAAAIMGIGNNATRLSLADRYSAYTKWQTYVHPTAYIHPSVKVGRGTVVLAGAIIQPDVVIGDHCIINTGATIDHDCIIGNFVHLAPGVHLAGAVHVGEGSFMGIGSVTIQEIKIGDWVQVAAGSVVIRNLVSKSKVMGVPATERV